VNAAAVELTFGVGAALWPELSDGTLTGDQRSDYPCLHSDDEPVEAPARASFCAFSKSISSAGLVQRTSGDGSACSSVCRGRLKNSYCSADPN
jgi:hypothetical protein